MVVLLYNCSKLVCCNASGASAGNPEPLSGTSCAVLGRQRRALPVFWHMLAILGFYWRSWGALRAAVCSPGPLLEAMLAVLAALGRLLGSRLAILGRSWGLCCRSWAALWAAVCDPGPLLRPMLAVSGCSLDLCGRSGAERCQEHGYLDTCLFL